MKAPQEPQTSIDRLSTREELNQVLDVLLAARDQRIAVEELSATFSDAQVDSDELAAGLWNDSEEGSAGLLDEMVPLAELFPADHARVVN